MLPPPPPVVADALREVYPLATTPLGRLEVCGVEAKPLVGYLLVCGRGLFSLDLPSFELPGFARRFGVDWLPRLFEPLCRRVFSNSQCVQFFQVATIA